jgi:peroxiredoxin Q/BCP
MLLSDPDHQVAEAYGVWSQRSMFGNKYFGIARSHFIIDENGNLVVEARKISPKDSVKKGTSFFTRAQKAPTK